MSAQQVANAIAKGIRQVWPDAAIDQVPMADGGEGTLEVLAALEGFTIHHKQVSDPLFRPVTAGFGLRGTSAYVEMATASGLLLLPANERNPMNTTSLGTGELIKHCIEKGSDKIHLFVGGSATNDGGTGILAALGCEFLDDKGNILPPTGRSLSKIVSISMAKMVEVPEIVLVTDVRNTLCGPQGAAFQYAEQKGASPDEIVELDRGLENLALVIEQTSGIDVADREGVGAAGGVGACLVGLLDAKIQSGTDSLLAITGIANNVHNYDLVITGEGKLDEQTLQGKVVAGVARLAHEHSIDVLAICGVNKLITAEQVQRLGIRGCAPLLRADTSIDECMRNASQLVTARTAELLSGY